jgi:hypothetical protein
MVSIPKGGSQMQSASIRNDNDDEDEDEDDVPLGLFILPFFYFLFSLSSSDLTFLQQNREIDKDVWPQGWISGCGNSEQRQRWRQRKASEPK